MKQIALAIMLVMGVYQVSFAHEGHDKTPGAIVDPNPEIPGTVKITNQLYVKMVNESAGIKVYLFTHESISVPLKELTLQGSVTFPKKTKAESVKFTEAGNYFSAKVDAKGSYRYTLDLTITYKGKKEKVNFQIEPQG